MHSVPTWQHKCRAATAAAPAFAWPMLSSFMSLPMLMHSCVCCCSSSKKSYTVASKWSTAASGPPVGNVCVQESVCLFGCGKCVRLGVANVCVWTCPLHVRASSSLHETYLLARCAILQWCEQSLLWKHKWSDHWKWMVWAVFIMEA